MKWYNLDNNKVLKELNTEMEGLTTKEATKRLSTYGLNKLPKKETESFLKIFIRGLFDPLVILLIITVIFSFLINEIIDAFVIIFIIVLDLLLGAFQEWKAEKNADSLSKLIKVNVKTKRDNNYILLDSEYLVPGDIIELESGAKIPTDIRILTSDNLTVDESILTGESINIPKTNETLEGTLPLNKRSNMLYSGTTIIKGRVTGVVIATSLNTEIGKIATSLTYTKSSTSPLTIRMNKFSKQISLLIIIISILIAYILYLKGIPRSEIFLSVIALAVSAMPEGLPLALTMALTIGSNRMAKKQVIVKRLNAVESLGSCTVIASDKTGTLTLNEQKACLISLPDNTTVDLTTDLNYNEKVTEIATLGYINNEALKSKDNTYIGDTIDIAFLKLATNLKIKTNTLTILKRIPYESENGYSAVFYETNGKTYVTVKGALEKVLAFSKYMNTNKTKINKELIQEQNNHLASLGYRLIAVASGEIKIKTPTKYDLSLVKDLIYKGLVAFQDPIREDAKNSIKECLNAGIKVLMITGDQPLTAYSIGKSLGLITNKKEISTSYELEKELKKGEQSFCEYIKTKTVFSEVTPLNKLEIVNALKKNGEFVAVTGDGVNDAPALKAANIGVAMGSGTDIAKETSSMILQNDDFTSLVEGIKEGRNAYNNIRKVCYFLISCGLAEVLFFVLSVIFNLPMPLVAIQLLWLNLVTDGLQDFSLSFEKMEDNIMTAKPRDPKENLFNKELLKEVLISGLTMGLLVFLVWYYLLSKNMEVTIARGYIMCLMVFLQNMHALNCRSECKSLTKIPIWGNPSLIITIVTSILLQIIIMEIPLLSNILETHSIPFSSLIYLFLLSLTIILVIEIYKLLKKNYQKNISN